MADGTRGAKRVAATLGPEQGREPDELERLVAGTLQGLVAAAPEAASGPPRRRRRAFLRPHSEPPVAALPV